MSMKVLIPFLAPGLAGCAAMGPFEPDSPYWLPPVGSEVELQQALELANGTETLPVAPRAAKLIVDGRLAGRLGIAVGEGDEIEVRR